jgi:AraC-like DNA-binding protein
MPIVESWSTPQGEAQHLHRLVKLGLETPLSVRQLLRITPREARFLDGSDIIYRAQVRVHFENLLAPGSVPLPAPEVEPARQYKKRNPPPPTEVQQAISEALTELMDSQVQSLYPPVRPRRGPYRKRIPPNEIASAAISLTARHFGVTVQELITPVRGIHPAAGIPRWSAVLALRNCGLRVREIVDAIGFTDPSGVYAALDSLRQARSKDQELDREISELFASIPGNNLGHEPRTQAPAQRREPLHAPRADACQCTAAA